MPIKTITAPGSTVGVNILKSGTNYTTVRNATAGTNAGNEDNKFTLNAKAGSNFFIRRGILLYDFSTAHLPRGAKVVKAQLILNDVIESAGQTHGDKIRVGWIHNPNTFGAIHANDFNRARYSGQYTTAHQLTNGADGEIIELNHRILLRQLQKAINNKTWLHLVIRNENDHAGTTPAAANSGKVWFDRPNADNNPLQLRIFYRTIGNVRHQGAGTGRTSRSGFGGSNVFSGTNSGFDNG